MVVPRGCQGERNGVWFIGYRISVQEHENVLAMKSGEYT